MKAIRFTAICTALLTISTMCVAGGQVRGPKTSVPNAPRLSTGSGDMETQWWGPGPGKSGRRMVAHGTVTHVDANRLDVQAARGAMAFVVNEQTKVLVRGQLGRITDVKQNDVVNVKFQRLANNVLVATGVMVPKNAEAPKARVHGKIASVEGNVIVITSENKPVSVTLTSETKILSRRYVGSVADLKVGYKVVVGGDPAAAKFVEFLPEMAKGAVTAIDGDVITVKTINQRTLELKASQATSVLVRPRVGPNVKGTLADVKVGSPVNIGYHTSDGVAPLLWIDVLTGM